MTDPSIAVAALDSSDQDSSVIYKAYLSSIDEVVDSIRSADTLGLGFRVESYMVSSAEEPESAGEFEFTLLGEMPTKVENHD